MFSFLREKSPIHPPLYLHDSASATKKLFTPHTPGKVTIYACGPTVYDHIHIGNLRAYLLPDLLQRLFLYHGYDVALTINFTDFGHLVGDGDTGEDKIMRGMTRDGYPITLAAMRDFVVPYIESFKRDNASFGNLPATTYTRASDYVAEQIALIETLIKKGHAYEAADGVYFSVETFPTYGCLGHIDITKQSAGARVEVNPHKHHPADFTLWKKADLGWNSAWGTGSPGWHIECTAMAFSTLGHTLDIHTGGEDLMYTHHNGEIAQAECATGKEFVHYWLHNAHVTIADQKIAKSAGNGFRLDELEDKGFHALDYRYLLLLAHYRSPVNFSEESLAAAAAAREKLARFIYEEAGDVGSTPFHAPSLERVFAALHDDLNTAAAVASLFEIMKDTALSVATRAATIREADSVLHLGLSLDIETGIAHLGYLKTTEIPPEVTALLEEREVARIARNWLEADRLRDHITQKGFMIEDTAEGPKLSRLT